MAAGASVEGVLTMFMFIYLMRISVSGCSSGMGRLLVSWLVL